VAGGGHRGGLRSRRAPLPLVAARRDHLVVCGEDALACRVIEELATRYGRAVAVLLRSHAQGCGPLIAALPRVRVIQRAEPGADAFSTARVQSAQAVALVGQDDLGNFHAALWAQELNPGLRLVVRIFNTSLGERMRTFFHDCAVLSGSSMAAPSFVAAALGEPAPSHGGASYPVYRNLGLPQLGCPGLRSVQIFRLVLMSHLWRWKKVSLARCEHTLFPWGLPGPPSGPGEPALPVAAIVSFVQFTCRARRSLRPCGALLTGRKSVDDY
jgi:hypothetical protein